MFRVFSKHYSALERQVAESVLIEEISGSQEICLNLKNEWAGSKLPGVMVSRPKGTSSRGNQPEAQVSKRTRNTESRAK